MKTYELIVAEAADNADGFVETRHEVVASDDKSAELICDDIIKNSTNDVLGATLSVDDEEICAWNNYPRF